MIILITGGSGSGKSSYAEDTVLGTGIHEKYYIATMQIYGKEGLTKVERHRKLRANKGFVTIERQTEIGKAVSEIQSSHSVVLLECMSNLVANEMFGSDGQRDKSEVLESVLSGVQALEKATDTLVIVTNNVFEDGIIYDDSTMEYIKTLGEVNNALACMAKQVVEVVVGIPVKIK